MCVVFWVCVCVFFLLYSYSHSRVLSLSTSNVNPVCCCCVVMSVSMRVIIIVIMGTVVCFFSSITAHVLLSLSVYGMHVVYVVVIVLICVYTVILCPANGGVSGVWYIPGRYARI